MAQSFDDQDGVGQKQVLTMYELGKGTPVIRAFATSDAPSRSAAKTSARTMFTLIITESPRPIESQRPAY